MRAHRPALQQIQRERERRRLLDLLSFAKNHRVTQLVEFTSALGVKLSLTSVERVHVGSEADP
jgi:hypothetical protein